MPAKDGWQSSTVLISVCWTTKLFVKYHLFSFTPCLFHHSHPVSLDQTKESLCRTLESRPTQAQRYITLAPLPFQTAPTICLFRHLNCNHQEMSQNTFVWPGLPPIDTRARWPVDVKELLHRFCCWTLIRLLRHWAFAILGISVL